MNTKNNSRARETREKINMAVYRAVTEEHRPLNRITVREVCEKAGINRSTFYAHFLDIYDVVEKAEREMSERLVLTALDAADETPSVPRIFERVFAFIGENREFYRIYFDEIGQNGIIGVAWDVVNERTRPVDHRSLGFRSQAEMEYMGVLFLNGISAVIRLWIKNGCRETPQEMTEYLMRFYGRTVPVREPSEGSRVRR